MTAIYDLDYVDSLNKYSSAFKIGSGDITWKEILTKIAKQKACFLATGASDIKDVDKALRVFSKFKNKIVLMQCNTNYTGENYNYNYINQMFLKHLKRSTKTNIFWV